MATPRVCVLRAPGTNCDVETAHAFERAGADADRVHVFRMLDEPQLLAGYQILCIPGGFSYGDDVGAGVVFGSQLKGRLSEAVLRFLQADTLTLGICNGFQVLVKAGLLPGPVSPSGVTNERETTLTWNHNGRYTARWVTLEVGQTPSVFLRDIERLELPVAHAEGRIVVKDPQILEGWRKSGQAALRYAAPRACRISSADFPRRQAANPNGSVADLAGISDPTGRIFGLMPHPERYIDATQHPQWTRRGATGPGDGLRLFQNAVRYFN